MFHDQVLRHYATRGYRVHENGRLRGASGRIHLCHIIAEGPLGSLVVTVNEEDGGTELANLKAKAKDLGVTAVLAVPEARPDVRHAAAQMGIAVLERRDLAPLEESFVEPDEGTPWPDPAPRKAAASAGGLWKHPRAEETLNANETAEAAVEEPAGGPAGTVARSSGGLNWLQSLERGEVAAEPVPVVELDAIGGGQVPGLGTETEDPEAPAAPRNGAEGPVQGRAASGPPIARTEALLRRVDGREEPPRPHASVWEPTGQETTSDAPPVQVPESDPRPPRPFQKAEGRSKKTPAEVGARAPRPAVRTRSARLARRRRFVLTAQQTAQAAVAGLVSGLVIVGLAVLFL